MSAMAKPPNDASSEVTPEAHYLRRREFIKNAVLFTGTTAAVGGGLLWVMSGGHSDPPEPPSAPQGILGTAPPLPKPEANDGSLARGPFSTDEPLTPYKEVTGYNNFYEFGLDKSDPAQNAGSLHSRPWTVSIEGEVNKPQIVDIDTLLGWRSEERRVGKECRSRWS